MRSLVRHHWPGNIRELQNYIVRGVILSNDGLFKVAPLESCEPLKPEIAMRQIACGLVLAHDHGIFHRDLKPENIFITGTGHVAVGSPHVE